MSTPGPHKELMVLIGNLVVRLGGEWDGRVAVPLRGAVDTMKVAEAILSNPAVLDAICEYRARQINAEKSDRQPCPATHPCGPCLGEVGHGEIHWVLTPHGTRAIWTEDV